MTQLARRHRASSTVSHHGAQRCGRWGMQTSEIEAQKAWRGETRTQLLRRQRWASLAIDDHVAARQALRRDDDFHHPVALPYLFDPRFRRGLARRWKKLAVGRLRRRLRNRYHR